MENHKSLGRRLALQTLYQKTIIKNTDYEISSQLVETVNNNDLSADAVNFSKKLVDGVLKNRADIDNKIQAMSPKWKVQRMSVIDLNLMRLATYEMLYENLKPSIAINEAVELAKVYGTTDSKAFVNALLDSIAKEMIS